VIAEGTVIALLIYKDMISTKFIAFALLILLINISGAVAVLSTLAGTILVEREW
jgi:solute carrier family 40 (iron-regulated transporter), member 1